jgi:hypothetical protein
MEGASTGSEQSLGNRRDNDAPPDLEDDVLSELAGGAIAHGGASACGGASASHAASGLRSGLASGASHMSRGSQVPVVIGGRSSAGPHYIIPTGNYFDASVWRSHRVVSAWKVVCPKEKCGAQGSRDYSHHHLAATATLPELFGAAKHFHTKNTDGEVSYKYKDIQSEYVGNLNKLKLFRKRMEAFDMFDPFLIPVWIDPRAFSVIESWGDRKSNAIDLTKHWFKVSLEHVCAWQRDTFDWCTDDNDLTSMEWIKELLTNSCDIHLVKRVDEKFDQLYENEQGGITYLIITLDEMFTMSNIVIMSLQKYLKQLAQDGVAKVPNEDVRICLEQIAAVCPHLAKVDALPQEAPEYILKGFTWCLVVEFRDIHKLLATTDKVRQMRAVSGRRDSAATLAAVTKLCSEANEVFSSLNLTNKWNIPQYHRADAFVPICYNCGLPDHTSDKCFLPRNEAKIMKAKEASANSIAEERTSGGRGRGCGHGGKGGCWGDRTNTWGKWGLNDGHKDPKSNKTSATGFEKRNGSWMMNCKSCRWNDTYTSWYHGD